MAARSTDAQLETRAGGLSSIAERVRQPRSCAAPGLTLTTVAADARFGLSLIASVRVARTHPHHRLVRRRHAAPGMASRIMCGVCVEEIVALLAQPISGASL